MTPEFCAFYGVLTSLWTVFLWKQYLALRQRRVYTTTDTVPEKLTDVLDVKTFLKAKSYCIEQSTISIVKEWYNMILSTTFICFNGFASLWNLSKYCLTGTRYADSEIMITCVFNLFMHTMSTITCLPTSVYSTVLTEENHVFSKEMFCSLIGNEIKNFILVQVLALPINAATITVVIWGGRSFFIWLWAFTVITSFFALTIYPEFIAPLFDKYTLLPDGPLKTKIEELAKQVNFPLFKIYIAEGCRLSAHSNAYFYGFFNSKRIVLYDTLLKDSKDIKGNKTLEEENKNNEGKRMNDEEILAILSHEFGHWKLNHILCDMVLFQLNLFIMLFVFGWLHDNSLLYRAFGFSKTDHPVVVGLLIIFQYVFSSYYALLSFAMNTFSRQSDFQADSFAKKLGKAKALESGLIRLNNNNIGFPVYDSLYSSWHHAHPQLLERLEAISKTD